MQTLLKPRWIVFHLLVFTLAFTFFKLGVWQWQRHQARQVYNSQLKERLEAAPIAYAELKSILTGTSVAEGDGWYRVAWVEGKYDPDHELLIRNRSFQSQAGYHVLTPLLLASGKALLIERGWVPLGLDTPPIEPAAPPEGKVRVEGFMLPPQPQPTGFAPKDPTEGTLHKVFWVDTERLQPQMPYALEPAYLRLAKQTPAQPAQQLLPALPPVITISGGPHLSYAVQWFAFMLIALIGYSFLMRSIVKQARTHIKTEGF